MSHTAWVRPCTAFIRSKERKGSPLIRVTRRGPWSGRTGRATFMPRSWWSRVACRPGKSMNGYPMQNPWTPITQGRVGVAVAEHGCGRRSVGPEPHPSGAAGFTRVGGEPALPRDPVVGLAERPPLTGGHVAGGAGAAGSGGRRRGRPPIPGGEHRLGLGQLVGHPCVVAGQGEPVGRHGHGQQRLVHGDLCGQAEREVGGRE